jgi:hypothetical protein
MFVRSLCATAVAIVTFGSPALSAAQPNLAGGWRVTVDPGPDAEYLIALFNQGGTLEVVSDGVAAGVWQRTGTNNFAATLDGFELVDRFRVRMTIQMLDNNTLRGTFTIERMTPDGKHVLSFEGQGRLVGQRMRVVPES